MSRKRRLALGGYVYHVCNRGSRKGVLFETSDDFDDFVRLMDEARAKRSMRIIGYCLMRTHVHFLLWPQSDGDMSRFMQWIASTHARRFHRRRGTKGTGAVYQSRYVSTPIKDDRHLLIAWRYVEMNPVTAKLVQRAEEWRWSSARPSSDPPAIFTVDPGPVPRPATWLDIVNSN
ncbi:MAG TPA: transposase [Vicinamibacterales bacterium]|jgi:putative transposase